MFSRLNDYKQWLDQFFAANRTDYNHTMLEAVRFLGQKQEICTLLKLVLTSNELMQQVASQSYLHYNGFDKIVLLSSTSPQYKLRLHTWWPSSDGLIIEHIHNHRWDFSSVILTGSYRSQEFRNAENSEDIHEYRYTSPEGQNHYSMEYVGTAKLECVFDSIMTAGSHYNLCHSLLHRVVSDRKSLTATLVLQGPVKKSFTNVFSFNKMDNNGWMNVPPLSVFDLSQKLQSSLATLEAELLT